MLIDKIKVNEKKLDHSLIYNFECFEFVAIIFCWFSQTVGRDTGVFFQFLLLVHEGLITSYRLLWKSHQSKSPTITHRFWSTPVHNEESEANLHKILSFQPVHSLLLPLLIVVLLKLITETEEKKFESASLKMTALTRCCFRSCLFFVWINLTITFSSKARSFNWAFSFRFRKFLV